MITWSPWAGGIVKSLVLCAVKPWPRTSCTAFATADCNTALVVGGVVGGVVAGGPLVVVVVSSVDSGAVDADAFVVEEPARDAFGPADDDDDDADDAIVVDVDAALEEPPELHPHMTKTATQTNVTRARVRATANAFIRCDATDRSGLGRAWDELRECRRNDR
jgi:hypothetical protein